MNAAVQRFPARPAAATLQRMRLRIVPALALAAGLIVPAAARADLHHVVAPGETLTSLAASSHVSIDALAGANRLAPTAFLIAGSVLRIPPAGAGLRGSAAGGSPRPAAPAVSHAYRVLAGDTLSGLAARAGISTDRLAALNHLRPDALLIAGATIMLPGTAASTAAAAPALTRYTVRPGDTLSGLAAHAGISTDSLATLNHLPPDALLIIGESINLPAAAASTGGPPYPTAERVTAPEVDQIAAENGVPSFLAAAVAWQESGFNNDEVSAAGARGVMQILPGTWAWIQDTLTMGDPLAPRPRSTTSAPASCSCTPCCSPREATCD